MKPPAISAPSSTFDGVVQTLTGTATKTWDAYSLVLTVSNAQYNLINSQYYLDGQEGQNLTGSVSLTKTLDIGGNITLTGSGAELGSFTQGVDDPNAPPAPTPAPGAAPATPTPQVVAKGNGTQYGVLASIKLAPVDWLFGLISIKYAHQDFSGIDPALLTEFQQATPENITTFKLQLGLTKTF